MHTMTHTHTIILTQISGKLKKIYCFLISLYRDKVEMDFFVTAATAVSDTPRSSHSREKKSNTSRT